MTHLHEIEEMWLQLKMLTEVKNAYQSLLLFEELSIIRRMTVYCRILRSRWSVACRWCWRRVTCRTQFLTRRPSLRSWHIYVLACWVFAMSSMRLPSYSWHGGAISLVVIRPWVYCADFSQLFFYIIYCPSLTVADNIFRHCSDKVKGPLSIGPSQALSPQVITPHSVWWKWPVQLLPSLLLEHHHPSSSTE